MQPDTLTRRRLLGTLPGAALALLAGPAAAASGPDYQRLLRPAVRGVDPDLQPALSLSAHLAELLLWGEQHPREPWPDDWADGIAQHIASLVLYACQSALWERENIAQSIDLPATGPATEAHVLDLLHWWQDEQPSMGDGARLGLLIRTPDHYEDAGCLVASGGPAGLRSTVELIAWAWMMAQDKIGTPPRFTGPHAARLRAEWQHMDDIATAPIIAAWVDSFMAGKEQPAAAK